MTAIKTHHAYPPIPIRTCDWQACYKGREETGPFGEGLTERAAIDELVANYDVEQR